MTAIVVLLSISIVANSAFLYMMYIMRTTQRRYYIYTVEKNEEIQNKIGILSKVLKIFEDETQVLQKRNENIQALQERFSQKKRELR